MRILVHISDAVQIDARYVAHPYDQVFPQQFDGFNGVGKPDFILHLACNQDTAQGLVVQADNVVNNCGHKRAVLSAVGELFLGAVLQPFNNFINLDFLKLRRIFAVLQDVL